MPRRKTTRKKNILHSNILLGRMETPKTKKRDVWLSQKPYKCVLLVQEQTVNIFE